MNFAIRDAAFCERNNARTAADCILGSFGFTPDQTAAILSGATSAFRYRAHDDRWECADIEVGRPTVESLERLGVVEPVSACALDRTLTRDGEAVARVLERRAKRRARR